MVVQKNDLFQLIKWKEITNVMAVYTIKYLSTVWVVHGSFHQDLICDL